VRRRNLRGYRVIADAQNARDMRPRRRWHATTVRNLLRYPGT
jgi:hypothetical protein